MNYGLLFRAGVQDSSVHSFRKSNSTQPFASCWCPSVSGRRRTNHKGRNSFPGPVAKHLFCKCRTTSKRLLRDELRPNLVTPLKRVPAVIRRFNTSEPGNGCFTNHGSFLWHPKPPNGDHASPSPEPFATTASAGSECRSAAALLLYFCTSVLLYLLLWRAAQGRRGSASEMLGASDGS